MARRSAQSFVKRQKEMARKERQAQKAQKRLERKHNKGSGPEIAGEVVREMSIEEIEAAEAEAVAEPEAVPEPALSSR
jgi:hypothetical protein